MVLNHAYMGLVGVVYGAESCIPDAVRLVALDYGGSSSSKNSVSVSVSMSVRL